MSLIAPSTERAGRSERARAHGLGSAHARALAHERGQPFSHFDAVAACLLAAGY